jgi:hypothetical protein
MSTKNKTSKANGKATSASTTTSIPARNDPFVPGLLGDVKDAWTTLVRSFDMPDALIVSSLQAEPDWREHVVRLAKYIAAHRPQHQMVDTELMCLSFAASIAEETMSTILGASALSKEQYDGYSGRNTAESVAIVKVGWALFWYKDADKSFCRPCPDHFHGAGCMKPVSGPRANHYITHGFRSLRDHPDFEIVTPMSPDESRSIFQHFYDRVEAGEDFSDGDVFLMSGDQGLRFKLVKILFGFTHVFRLIFSDVNLEFTCDRSQLEHYPLYRSLFTAKRQV